VLSDLIQALISRLSPLDAPIYQADCVPANAPCPYITLSAAAPLGDTAGAFTLTVWHSTNAGRIALAEEIIALLPRRGLTLPLPSGHAVITGGTSAFLKEGPLPALRMTWKLRLYPSA